MSKIAELEALLDERPDDPFLIYALAREYEKRSATLQALLMYEHLINDHPDYIGTYYHYAKLLYSGGNRNEGLRLVKMGIENGLKVNEMHAVSELKVLLSTWAAELDEED